MTPPIDDEPLPPEIQNAAQAYHRPPPPPREELWVRIRMARAAKAAAEAQQRRAPAARRFGSPALRWRVAGGIAALLAIGVGIGVGIGRLSVRPSPPSSPAGVPVAKAPGSIAGTAFQVAAVEHLGQAESCLTLFRASVRQGDRDTLSSPAARQLLATNRLLLDSPASADPRLRLLLEDLELVLAGIAQLAPGRNAEELDLITDGLERGGMLVRLRAAVPAGGAPPARLGVL